MVRSTRWCGAGGYKIRPYGPASGFPVGAAYMAARNRVLIRAVVRRFSCRRGAHGASACPRRARQSADRCGRRAACPTCRRDRVHRPPVLQKSYPVTDARCAPLRRVRSAEVRPTRRCGTGGHTGRPYGPACRGLAGRSWASVPVRDDGGEDHLGLGGAEMLHPGH